MMPVIGTRVNSASYSHATEVILAWSTQRESRYVCAANVHVLMEAHDSLQYSQIVNSADLVIPDGMPVVWMMRAKGLHNQQRVYGPTLMLHLIEAAVQEKIAMGFYGSTPEVLEALFKRLQGKFPTLNIVFSFSPPFRELSQGEDDEIVRKINESGVQILFIGLGCPKQERWMAKHRGRVMAAMIGVGAAFDFHAGMKSQAPVWIQRIGMEWLFRLTTEPRRLWRRYLYHNPRFVLLAISDLLGFLR